MSETTPQVRDEADAQRWVAEIDGEVAGYAEYTRDGSTVTFTHTVVDDAFEGRGVGSALARTALDATRDEGSTKVVAQCSFIRGWIDKHPDYQDLLA
ncbi:GNAT family N-acetyltransferase [Nocardioides marmotae]|uniref:GNAT family N-acetyltransferase n=1 Tax=Nocardioides marmotae TaxID=2663857 RepID=UPI0012B61AB5|nr:GNAT family N-acetyltransferase [Nocardioides marmotae]MBC9735460.1 N-acetyltransferase [Nocardioides marmotae]MTB86557.1 GNAT family N-acetyltransferase [Nocardioides marmotae]